jgi:hypothetical protein
MSEDRSKRLERMRQNPLADWTIEDVEAVCREHDIRCSPPKGGGSHYKISHPRLREILTIPRRRPIKPVYIRRLIKFIESCMLDAIQALRSRALLGR